MFHFFTEKPIPLKLAPKQKWYQRMFSRQPSTGWEAGRDLTQVKAELNNLLLAQPNRIVIIIDNISRLYDHEIKQVLQIVKSIGNFSHTSYLLALDKDRVVDALTISMVAAVKNYWKKSCNYLSIFQPFRRRISSPHL